MADEQKPGGSPAPSPNPGQPSGQPAKPRASQARGRRLPSRPPSWRPRPGIANWRARSRSGSATRVDGTSTYLGQNFIVAKPDAAVPVLEYLKLEADFDYLVDITAVDWPKRAERFDLVYIVYSFRAQRARAHQDAHRRRLSSRAPPWACT